MVENLLCLLLRTQLPQPPRLGFVACRRFACGDTLELWILALSAGCLPFPFFICFGEVEVEDLMIDGPVALLRPHPHPPQDIRPMGDELALIATPSSHTTLLASPRSVAPPAPLVHTAAVLDGVEALKSRIL